jgi:hypothetical protein
MALEVTPVVPSATMNAHADTALAPEMDCRMIIPSLGAPGAIGI